MAIIASMARVSSPIFVGRGAELKRLSEALELATNHRPATRLVGGDAGIGKTRLVSEFVAGARASGAHVMIGDCLQLGETGLPYAPFVGALRPLIRSLPHERLDELIGPGASELSHLLPDLGSPPAPAGRRDRNPSAGVAQARMFEIVFGLLRRLADDQPVVLILEDLHWADSSTRDLLRFLVRNARDARFLVIGTYRSIAVIRCVRCWRSSNASRGWTTSSSGHSARTSWPTSWPGSPERHRIPSSFLRCCRARAATHSSSRS